MSKPQIVAQMFNLRNFCKTPEDIAASLEKVAKIGYKYVQLSGLGPVDPKELDTMMRSNGLKPVVTHNKWASFTDDIDQLIQNHRLWGCPFAGVGSMPGDYRGGEEKWYEFARLAQQAADRLSAAGMAFTYHNHAFEFIRFGDKTGMDILKDNTRDNVQLLLDLFWVQAGGADILHWIGKCAGRLRCVHFKDWMVDVDGNRYMTEIGDGNLNWAAIIPACIAAGTEWFIIERDDGLLDPFDSLARSLDNLGGMMQRI